MFLLKKIIAQFFNPVFLVLALSLSGLYLLYFSPRQKSGKMLVLISVILLVLCSYTPTADILVASLEKQYPLYELDNESSAMEMPKFVVVLGAGHYANDSMPVMSRIGHDAMFRLIEGIRIYRMMPGSKLLLSGGSTSGEGSGAEDMAEIAKGLGINEEDIIIESESLDTDDQAQIVHSMIGVERFVLVTSAIHMPRSMALFKKLGMNPVPASTRSLEEKLYSRTPNPFFPSSVNLQKAEMAFHEYLGIVWAKLRQQI